MDLGRLISLDPSPFGPFFPSSNDLKRVVDWGPMQARSQKVTLQFETSSSGGRVKATLENAWIQFNGLPLKKCTYPTIWGIGSTLGVTREVDMPFFQEVRDLSYAC
jgi:hypothetical protein